MSSIGAIFPSDNFRSAVRGMLRPLGAPPSLTVIVHWWAWAGRHHVAMVGPGPTTDRRQEDEPGDKPDPVPDRLTGPGAAIPLETPLPAPSSRPQLLVEQGPAVAAYPGARAGNPRTLPVWPCSGWGLPSRAGRPARWWSLTPPFHPYRASARTAARRSVLCGTVPRVTPGGCYPPPCPVESGLSSAGGAPPDAAACPARPSPMLRRDQGICGDQGIRRAAIP